MHKTLIVMLISLMFGTTASSQDITDLINRGELSEAVRHIRTMQLDETTTQAERHLLEKQRRRAGGINARYRHSYDAMLEIIRREIPDITDAEISAWEENSTLEYRMIDGKKSYSKYVRYNLFALNKEAEGRRGKKAAAKTTSSGYDHIAHKTDVIAAGASSLTPYVLPKTIKVNLTFFVDVAGIPDGEIVRGWLPVPRDMMKQQDIRIMSSVPDQYLLSNTGDHLNASMYVEQHVNRAVRDTAYWTPRLTNPPHDWMNPFSRPEMAAEENVMMFEVMFEYTSSAYYKDIHPDMVEPYDTDGAVYRQFTSEAPPAIQFTEYLSTLSNDIIAGETNSYLKAKNIYAWVCRNIVWTNPDYQSAPCLSQYIAASKRGDCGSKALLFVALCRMNGIPARLQGGWMTRPNRNHSQHGWAQMFIEPFGWLTVDPDAGSHLIDHEDEQLRYFHFGNTESYRLVIYDDNSPLYPFKIHGDPNGGSVAGGLQLGAFEWAGGELGSDVMIDSFAEK